MQISGFVGTLGAYASSGRLGSTGALGGGRPVDWRGLDAHLRMMRRDMWLISLCRPAFPSSQSDLDLAYTAVTT